MSISKNCAASSCLSTKIERDSYDDNKKLSEREKERERERFLIHTEELVFNVARLERTLEAKSKVFGGSFLCFEKNEKLTGNFARMEQDF